jgi:hypothetical protein
MKEWVWNIDGMIPTEGNQITQSKMCPNDTFVPQNPRTMVSYKTQACVARGQQLTAEPWHSYIWS